MHVERGVGRPEAVERLTHVRFARSAAVRALVEAAPLVAALLLAVAVRAPFLGDAQLSRDEAASWYLASRPFDRLFVLSAHETFPPLYPLVLKAWMRVFGDGEVALRWLSVATGLASVAVAWRWTRDALGRHAALFVAGLVAVCPALILDSRLVRMYSLETFFSVAAWWLLWLLVADGPGWSRARRAVVAAAIALLVAGEVWSMSIGLPIAALQLAFGVACLAWLRAGEPALAVGATLVGAASLAPWLPNLLSVANNGQSFWTPRPGARSLGETISRWLGGDLSGLPLAVMAVVGVVAIVAAALAVSGIGGLWFGLRGAPPRDERRRHAPDVALAVRRDRVLALAIGFAVALVPALWLYSQVRSIYDARYLGSVFPEVAIALVVSLAIIRRRVRAATGSPAYATGAISVLLLVSMVGSTMALGAARAVDRTRSGAYADPAREAVRELGAVVRPGDVVVTINAQSFFPLEYYLVDSGVAARLGVRLYDWHRSSAAFFTGWRDIDPASIIDADAIDASGWGRAPHLAPGGSIWAVSLVDPDREFELFVPLESGALRELRRIEVRGPDSTAQLREAVPGR